VLLLLLLASVAPAQAARTGVQGGEKLRGEIAALYQRQARVRSISRAALSPDGLRVAWSVGGSTGGNQSIHVASVRQPSKAVRVTASQGSRSCNETEPAWSMDGKQLAFLSDCATPGQVQLFVEDLNASQRQPRQLTHLAGFLSHPQWSPDDENIALLLVERASRAPTPMAAENRTVGVIDDLRNADVQQLIVANVHTGATRHVTPAGLYVFEYDWSPDGRSFAFIASPPPGDDNWYIAQLYNEPLTGPKPVSLYKPRMQIALPRWAPSGKSIAFIQGLMSDQGGTAGEIYTVPAIGGQPRNLTPQRMSSPAWYTWLSDQEMLLTEFVGGSTAIGSLDVAHATAKRLWQGAETIRSAPEETSLSVSKRNPTLQMALIRASWSMLPEVWAGAVGEWKQLTHVNSAVDLPLPKFENVSWKSADFNVQGWLLYPRDYDPAKRYPMLVAVHGGPAWIATPTWRAADFNTTLFTNFGYFVFFPNARGSYGQGEKFTQANRRDWGFGDLRDILAGVDTIVKRYPVDDQRVGLLGWSYGGSMAMMAITQTSRFRAAVAGAGAGNWQSYYGQNSIDKWMISYFGASVYDDPAAYARCSAITYIKNAKTPTLVLVGERDGEAPPAQSIEFWHALKELGVDTQLVIYADEGHSFFKESDRIDVTLRTLQWFDQHMHAR
jgi:dipeptidyl aminopeptidase/acylaminoacyl peptidase